MTRAESDIEPRMWWEELPADEMVSVTVMGKMERVDSRQETAIKREQAATLGFLAVENIRAYIFQNKELFPSVETKGMTTLPYWGAVMTYLTPVECEILAASDNVGMIYPNTGEKLDNVE